MLSTRPEFIVSMAPFIQHLQINTQKIDFWDLLPHFTALQSLSLSGVPLTGDRIAKLPTSISSISIYDLSIPRGNGNKSLGNYLSKLRSIREFVFDATLNKQWIERLLANNKESLEHIGLFIPNKEPLETLTLDWHLVKVIPNLKHFTLKRRLVSAYCEAPVNDKSYMRKMLAILGARLHKITLELSPSEIGYVINAANLEHLQELEIVQRDTVSQRIIDAFRSLKELRKLTLKAKEGCKDGLKFQQIIESCPKLTHLSVSNPVSSLRNG